MTKLTTLDVSDFALHVLRCPTCKEYVLKRPPDGAEKEDDAAGLCPRGRVFLNAIDRQLEKAAS